MILKVNNDFDSHCRPQLLGELIINPQHASALDLKLKDQNNSKLCQCKYHQQRKSKLSIK